jgi:hypothetical protein
MKRLQAKNKFSNTIRRAALPVVLTASIMLGCRSNEPSAPARDSGPVVVDSAPPVAQQDTRPIPEPPPAVAEPEPTKRVKSRPIPIPRTFPAAMDALNRNGLRRAAEIIDRRVKQRSPKMKLTKAEAINLAGYLLRDLEQMPNTALLYFEMPRATLELVRAVHERGVSKQEAEKISRYLIRFIDSMDFGNLKQLDINHSHIIGREWEQIDYSGEPLDPARQKRNGQRMGVMNFKEARYIHKYFVHASKARYFKRIYRRNGKMPEL